MLSRRNVIVLLLVLLAVAAVVTLPHDKTVADSLDESGSAETQQVTTPTPELSGTPTMGIAQPTPSSALTYKDGTYTAEGDYQTPDGGKSVELTVTIKDDVVIDSSVKTSDFWGTTAQYQSMFKKGYAGQVNGKPVDSISLSRVSGSSLTSRGFNAALTAIKNEAKN